MTKRKLNRLVRESIMLAIDAIKEGINGYEDPRYTVDRAEAIKILTEAYKNVK